MKYKSSYGFLILALMQPLLWWFVNIALSDFATKHQSTGSLEFVCMMTAMLSMMAIAIFLIHKEAE